MILFTYCETGTHLLSTMNGLEALPSPSGAGLILYRYQQTSMEHSYVKARC